MARLMKLFLRTDVPRSSSSGEQIVDGGTVKEAMLPTITLRDGSSAVGTPWEFKYA